MPIAAHLSTGSEAPDRGRFRALQERCAELCYSAVLTLAALPDREQRWLAPSGGGSPAPVLSPAEIQREWGLDAGVLAERDRKEEQLRRATRFRPTPEEIDRCLPVLGWLTWLERERQGRAQRKIICLRAFGVSFRSIAERFGRSDETIARWENDALRQIVGAYRPGIEAMR